MQMKYFVHPEITIYNDSKCIKWEWLSSNYVMMIFLLVSNKWWVFWIKQNNWIKTGKWTIKSFLDCSEGLLDFTNNEGMNYK